MRLALPYENGQINQHFGRSREFAIVDVEGCAIKTRKNVSAANLQHNHEGLAGLMRTEGVDVVITGGIGAHALSSLEDAGLKVITGVGGGIDEVVNSYMRGELVSRRTSCQHHHGEHHGCHHN